MKSNLVRIAVTAVIAASFGELTFAAQPDLAGFVAEQPPSLQPLFNTLLSEGERNAVLNFNRLGLAAMQRGELQIAEKAFDESLRRIEAIYSNDPQARKAKSLWSEERVKDFKGEPYERAMAYYYRGLLYLASSDYENARAAFIGGEYQDTVSEKEEYAGDFAALNYLAGWASQCAGDTAQADTFYKAATSAAVGLRVPAVEDNALLIVDTGSAPRKTASGKHKELLEFVAGDASLPVAPLLRSAGGLELTPVLAADVNWQAATRGGRPVQAVLNGKAVWKDVATGTGDIAFAASSIASTASLYSSDLNQSMDLANAGVIAAGIGLFANLAAAAMKPAADTRYWDTLPGAIFLTTTVKGESSTWNAVVQGSSADVPPALAADSGRCSISWVSTGVSAPLADAAPNSALPSKSAGGKNARRKNEALQAAVLGW